MAVPPTPMDMSLKTLRVGDGQGDLKKQNGGASKSQEGLSDQLK